MKKLKLYIGIFITGLIAGIAVILNLTRGSDSDSELVDLANEGDGLAGEIEGLEAELDGLEVDELTDAESVDLWENL